MLLLTLFSSLSLADALDLPASPPPLIVAALTGGEVVQESCTLSVASEVLECTALPDIDVALTAVETGYSLQLLPISQQSASLLEVVVVYNPLSSVSSFLVEEIQQCASCTEELSASIQYCSELIPGFDPECMTLWGECSEIALTGRSEGFDEVASWFETLTKAEKSHAGQHERGLETLD